MKVHLLYPFGSRGVVSSPVLRLHPPPHPPPLLPVPADGWPVSAAATIVGSLFLLSSQPDIDHQPPALIIESWPQIRFANKSTVRRRTVLPSSGRRGKLQAGGAAAASSPFVSYESVPRTIVHM